MKYVGALTYIQFVQEILPWCKYWIYVLWNFIFAFFFYIISMRPMSTIKFWKGSILLSIHWLKVHAMLHPGCGFQEGRKEVYFFVTDPTFLPKMLIPDPKSMRILIPNTFLLLAWSLIPDPMKNTADPDPTHCDSRSWRCDPRSHALWFQILEMWSPIQALFRSLIPGARFSKVPKLFGRISADTILFVSWKQRRLEARNFAVIFIFNPFTTYEKTSFTE